MTCFAEGFEQDDDLIAGKMAAEVVVRPLGLVATVLGGAIFIVTIPFSALGGNADAAYNYLLADPFKFTFSRPLGDFKHSSGKRRQQKMPGDRFPGLNEEDVCPYISSNTR
jgi:hypothetical protein